MFLVQYVVIMVRSDCSKRSSLPSSVGSELWFGFAFPYPLLEESQRVLDAGQNQLK